MVELDPESAQSKSQERRTEDDVWSRLRASMERLSSIGQQKSDPTALAERLAQRAKQLRGRMAAAEPAEAPVAFVAFNKGRQRFGIPINDVSEVQALEHYSPVPHTPSFIPGVIHWRGEVLALLDLGNLFEIPESGLTDVHVSLIIDAAGRRVAIVANEIEEIHLVPRSEVKNAPELPGNIPAEWLLGVHHNDRLILNTESILQDSRLVDWRQ